VTLTVTEEAHWPVEGVNVYVLVPVDEVLIVEGLHVPLMPLVDVVGSTGAFAPTHSVGMLANVGVTLVVIVTVLLPVDLHPPLLVTVIPNDTEPDVPAVYLMPAVPLPDVIVPPLMVHA